MDRANGTRGRNTLSEVEAVALTVEARDTGFAWRASPLTLSPYGYEAVTTVALAVVREDESVALDIGRASYPQGNPAGAWPELSPWSEGSKAREKLREWAGKPERIVFPSFPSFPKKNS